MVEDTSGGILVALEDVGLFKLLVPRFVKVHVPLVNKLEVDLESEAEVGKGVGLRLLGVLHGRPSDGTGQPPSTELVFGATKSVSDGEGRRSDTPLTS